MAWLATILEAERDRLPLFLPVFAGAGVAFYFGLRVEPPLLPVLASLLLGLAILAVGRRLDAVRLLAPALLAILAGLLSAELDTRRALPLAPPMPRGAVTVAGVVGAIDVLPTGGRRLTLAGAALDGAPPLARRIRLRLRDGDPVALADGDRVSVRALLRPPARPAYPGAWDTERDAYYAGLAGAGFALGPATRLEAAPARVGAWSDAIRRVRDRIAARLERGLPGTRGAIAATLLVGEANAIPEADRQAFTDSGLAHLLAVAGLHIGIVMGLVLGAVRSGLALSERAALRWPLRAIAAVAALAAGGLYLVMTGAHVPIIRSFCMATLGVLALLLGRRVVSMRGLAAAAALILALWPDLLTGVSFQMSFAAVATLIAGYEIARPGFAALSGNGAGRRLALHVGALALTSLLAGAASLPYAAFHFGRVQLYFVVANLIAVPLTASWVMPLGLAALGLMPFGLERLALVPMGWGIGLILAVGRAVSGLRGAVFLVPQLPLAFLLLVSAGISLLCLLRTRVRLAGLLPLGAALAVALAARPPDLVVSEDGRLIAFPGPHALVVERHGASRYTVEAYQRLWAQDGEPARLPLSGTLDDAACAQEGCRIARAGRIVALVRTEGASPACDGLALLVSPRPLRDACPGVPRIDRFSVWRDGATVAWLTSRRVTLVSDRSARGDRPWLAPVAPRKPRRSSLPVIASE